MNAPDPNAAQADKLLRLRQDEVETARSALAEAAATAEQIQQRIDEATQAMAAHNAAAREALFRKAAYSELGVYRRCVDDLQAVVATQREWIGDARKRVRQRQQALGRSLARLKVARRLKGRCDARKDRDARRAETREHDDVHTARESTRRRGRT